MNDFLESIGAMFVGMVVVFVILWAIYGCSPVESKYLMPLQTNQYYSEDIASIDTEDLNFMDIAYTETDNIVKEYIYCSKCNMPEDLNGMAVIKPVDGVGRWLLIMTYPGTMKGLLKNKEFKFND